MHNKIGRPKEFNEEEAVAIAMDLFWTNSYEKTSLDDLMKAMKISKSSFYQTFKSKKDLFKRSLRFYLASHTNALEAMKSKYSSYMILKELLYKQFEEYKDVGSVRGCFLMNSGAECYSKHPDMTSDISRNYEIAIKNFASLILEAQQEGDIKNTMDSKSIAILYASSLTGMANTIKAGAPREVVQIIVDDIEKLIS